MPKVRTPVAGAEQFLAEIETTAHFQHPDVKEASILCALRGYECPEN